MKDWSDQGVEVDICAVGNKAGGFFSALVAMLLQRLKMLVTSPVLAT